MHNGKFQKKAKKLKILKKIPLLLHFNPKYVGKGCEKEKIKTVVPFRSYPMRNWKFQKNSKKIEKIKKYHYGFISSYNWLEKYEKQRK